MGGELLAKDLSSLCLEQSGITPEVQAACVSLGNWDQTYKLDSRGGQVFRQFMENCAENSTCYDGLWAVPFNPNDPVATPNTLNQTNTAEIMNAVTAGVDDLQSAKIVYDAPMSEIQFTRKGDTVIPIHGGPSRDGAFNMLYYNNSSSMDDTLLPHDVTLGGAASASLIDQQGYLINYGSSWMMLVNYLTDGTVQAKGLISYGQTTKHGSAYNTDQTMLFSQSQWRDCLFTEDEIMSDPNLKEEIIAE